MRWLALPLALTLASLASPARADDTSRRIVAALPFGVGQIQNGKIAAGIAFAAGEALLGGASVALVFHVNALASSLGQAKGLREIGRLDQRIQDATLANRISFASFVALAAVGIVEAELNFAPRRRDDACAPRAALVGAPIPGGGVLVVHGSF